MALNRAPFEAFEALFEGLFAGLDWRRVRALDARRPAAAGWFGRSERRAFTGASRYVRSMSALPDIDLSAIPEDQRDTVAALLRENGTLKGETADLREIVERLGPPVAELTHVVHGKKADKLDEARANGTPMERQWSERHWRAATGLRRPRDGGGRGRGAAGQSDLLQ